MSDNALQPVRSRVVWTPDDFPGSPNECPHCDEPYNAVMPTMHLELASPDEGEWCIWRGYFFIHEELRYPGQSPASE